MDMAHKDFQQYWSNVKECTSSSFSNVHFGHYIAASKDDYLSKIHTLSTELAYSKGYS
jgi:hypothetical protein